MLQERLKISNDTSANVHCTTSEAMREFSESLNLKLDRNAQEHLRNDRQLRKIDFLTDTHVDLPFDGSLVERRVIPVVPSVRIGSSFQEKPHDVSMAERASVVQRVQPSIVPGEYRCASI